MIRFLFQCINQAYRGLVILFTLPLYRKNKERLRRELAAFRDFLSERGLPPVETDSRRMVYARWETAIAQSFDSANSDRFYTDWVGETGALNIACSIYSQFQRVEMATTMEWLFSRHTFAQMTDIGCGTAALIWPYLERLQAAHLVDIANLPQEYVAYKWQRFDFKNIQIMTPEQLDDIPDHSQDLVFCADVLEHLTQPSELFCRHILRLMAPRGFLVLQVPFGGGVPEHIPEARRDWEVHAIPQLMGERLEKVRTIHPLMVLSGGGRISGVYRARRTD